MCGKYFALCALLLLIVALSSKSQQNPTNNEEKIDNLTVQHELNSMTNTNKIKPLRYDFYEKSINNNNNNTQHESHATSTNNDREDDDDSIQYELDTHPVQNHEDDKQISMGLRMNSTNVNHKRNFTSRQDEIYGNFMKIKDNNDSMSYELFENFSKVNNKSSIISYEMCYNITCIQLCCPLGDRLVDDNCIQEENKFFPNMYGYTNDDLLQSENKRVNDEFHLAIYDPCQKNNRFLLSDDYQYDYMIFSNGSLYLPYFKIFAKSTSYCLAVVDRKDKFKMIICSETYDEIFNTTTVIQHNDTLLINDNDTYDLYVDEKIEVSTIIMPIPFYVSIFLVYSILPELRSNAFMLRNYSGALSIANIIDIADILIKSDAVQYSICITIALFTYFFYLASFFWLTAMSFDMWWTFREFCSLQKNVKQRNKNKMMFYAIYAWGLPFIFAIILFLMDYFSKDLPKTLQPKFRAGNCWFHEAQAYILYYYGFKSICVFSSICLSISTALKIAHYEKDTNHHLTDSESKRYNNNKKWFNLYLKLFIVLFIVMGLKWFMFTALIMKKWLSKKILSYASYAVCMINLVQSFCTFIIFVWKKKIKRMLLKRFSDVFLAAPCATNARS